jgi:hypothetical protein
MLKKKTNAPSVSHGQVLVKSCSDVQRKITTLIKGFAVESSYTNEKGFT